MTNTYVLSDSVTAADYFCGGGGASDGVVRAGVDLKYAVNHDSIAIATHAANHPDVDHHQVDLLTYDIGKFPSVRMAHFSPSCKHHSQANAHKVYEQPTVLSEFIAGLDGHEEARSGYANSERSRVTMSCVLRYAATHYPDTMIVENVVEAAKWGPNRDGSTFAWWLRELDKLGYETEPVFLNSVAFGVPQSRDRMFVACWRRGMRAPNLRHRVLAWCPTCDAAVLAEQHYRQPKASWPMPRWGKLHKQYDYLCDRCHGVATLRAEPIASVLDFTDLGTRIGDRDKPLADSTTGRIKRYLEMHDHRLPFATRTCGAGFGATGWPADGPMGTVMCRNDIALCQMTVYGNTHEREGSTCRGRSVLEPTWAQHTTEAYGIAGCVVPFRQHTRPTGFDEPTHTQTADQVPGMATMGAMFAKNNGQAHDTAYHPVTDPANTITSRDTTSVVMGDGETTVDIDDVFFRMFRVDEIRGAMAYPDDFVFDGPRGEPSKRDKVRLLGDGVTPPVLEWLTDKMLDVM
jgi:site-specific DNA-cytosine methylase